MSKNSQNASTTDNKTSTGIASERIEVAPTNKKITTIYYKRLDALMKVLYRQKFGEDAAIRLMNNQLLEKLKPLYQKPAADTCQLVRANYPPTTWPQSLEK